MFKAVFSSFNVSSNLLVTPLALSYVARANYRPDRG